MLFVQFLLLCYEFCILLKTECKSIYYHFRRDHESSNFCKVAGNKWICRETWDFIFVKHTRVGAPRRFNILNKRFGFA